MYASPWFKLRDPRLKCKGGKTTESKQRRKVIAISKQNTHPASKRDQKKSYRKGRTLASNGRVAASVCYELSPSYDAISFKRRRPKRHWTSGRDARRRSAWHGAHVCVMNWDDLYHMNVVVHALLFHLEMFVRLETTVSAFRILNTETTFIT